MEQLYVCWNVTTFFSPRASWQLFPSQIFVSHKKNILWDKTRKEQNNTKYMAIKLNGCRLRDNHYLVKRAFWTNGEKE